VQTLSLYDLAPIDDEMFNMIVSNFDTDSEPTFGITMYETQKAHSFLAHLNSR
jgi:hypothetical protein